MRVNRLQASACMPLHLDVHKVAGKGVLTGEAVGAAATDSVDGGNGVELEEATPSLAP
jgi:pyruvate carboxylase